MNCVAARVAGFVLAIGTLAAGCAGGGGQTGDASGPAGSEGGVTVDTALSLDVATDGNLGTEDAAQDLPVDSLIDTAVDACGIAGACTPSDPCHVGRRTCGGEGEICEEGLNEGLVEDQLDLSGPWIEVAN